MSKRSPVAIAGQLCAVAILCAAVWGQDRPEDPRLRFKRWLEEDVVYIITDPERAVFESLQTVEEKERFIEQFWARRDPTPRTPDNEYKEEHYRRIQHANERFAAGRPGWRTDRGRIYVKFGEPNAMERRPTGGAYVRPMSEGGGITTANPFEIWRYNAKGVWPGE